MSPFPLSAADLHLVVRSLARRPLFALLVVGTLAVGVGATAAAFTYLGFLTWDNVTPDPESLVQISYDVHSKGDFPQPMSYPDFQDFVREAAAARIGTVTGYWMWGQGVHIGDDVAVWAWGNAVSDGFLETLGATPAVGRLLSADDHRPGVPRAAVLGHRFWRRHYDLAPDVAGKTIEIGAQTYTIIGVTREGFLGSGTPADLYTPLEFLHEASPEWTGKDRDPEAIWAGRVWAMVRAAKGTTRLEAQEKLRAIAGDLDRAHPLREGRRRELYSGYPEVWKQQSREALRMVGAAVALLILANVNVASLLVARYVERRRDLSVLGALGASIGRISTQLAVEGLLLSLIGGAVGIALSRALVAMMKRILITANPVDLGAWGEGAESSVLVLEWRVVAFAIASSIVTTLAFALLPTLHAARADWMRGLRAMAAGADRRTTRTQRILIAAQVALAVTLVAGAGLLIRSLANVRSVDPGFQTHNIAIGTLASVLQGEETDLRAAFEGSRRRAAAIPGVEDATLTDPVPLWGWRSSPIASPVNGPTVDVVQQVVGPRYFETVRHPIVRGRSLDHRDVGDAGLAVVVNQELARRFWPDSDPIGQSLPLGIPSLGVERNALVVGVAADVLQDLKQAPKPHLYLSGGQVRRPRMSLLLRTAVSPSALLSTIERELARVDPKLAMVNVATFDRHVESNLSEERLASTVGSITGGVSLALATTGIWSVLTYVVRSRRRESAVRTALGATPLDIGGRSMLELATPLAIGIAIGGVLAAAVVRLLRSQLFGIDPLDPVNLATAAIVVAVCGVLSALGPSLRAARVDPMTVLRED